MKVISMSELRKNIYAATRELPVEVQAKGKTLFYITESMFDDRKPEQPEQPVLDQEQQIRMTVKMVIEELSTRVPENKPRETGTIPVENTPIGTSPSKIEPEALWEDYNLMPVYKTGVPDQYCVTWHAKGEQRTVYPIKKFRADGSLEFEGKYCKECIKEFLAKDGHLE